MEVWRLLLCTRERAALADKVTRPNKDSLFLMAWVPSYDTLVEKQQFLIFTCACWCPECSRKYFGLKWHWTVTGARSLSTGPTTGFQFLDGGENILFVATSTLGPTLVFIQQASVNLFPKVKRLESETGKSSTSPAA